jgi:hypothetical protein
LHTPDTHTNHHHYRRRRHLLQANEGELSAARAGLVSNAALAARARALGLPRALRLLRYECGLWSRAETVRALEPRQVGGRAGLLGWKDDGVGGVQWGHHHQLHFVCQLVLPT